MFYYDMSEVSFDFYELEWEFEKSCELIFHKLKFYLSLFWENVESRHKLWF